MYQLDNVADTNDRLPISSVTVIFVTDASGIAIASAPAEPAVKRTGRKPKPTGNCTTKATEAQTLHRVRKRISVAVLACLNHSFDCT